MKESFWEILWNDGSISLWALKQWSATAIQGLKNAADVSLVQR